MQAARTRDELVPRPQEQVVGVRENDLGANLGEIPVGHGLDGATGPNRHERWRPHDAVWGPQLATTRQAIGMGDTKPERLRHCGILLPCPGRSTAISFFPAPVASHTADCSVRLRVGVIYGGRSSEHEVSIASAAAVIANLDPTRYEPVAIYIRRNGRWSLARKPPSTVSPADVIARSKSDPEPSAPTGPELHFLAHPADAPVLTIQREPDDVDNGARAVVGTLGLDVVFPVVHGPYGEDGTLQGLLELANVPYVGAGVLASAVGMDKAVAKTLFAAGGLPIVDYAVVPASQWDTDRDTTLDELRRRFAFPLFVKPANLGSSVGISKARDRRQLEQGIDLARQFDRKIIVEVSVPEARELECAVLGTDAPEASVVGEVLPAGEFYDYESKYVNEGSHAGDSGIAAHRAGRHDQGDGGRRLSCSRRLGDGPGRFSDAAGRRPDLRQRGEHDPRLHHHQHVREAVAGLRAGVPTAARPFDRARAGAHTPPSNACAQASPPEHVHRSVVTVTRSARLSTEAALITRYGLT